MMGPDLAQQIPDGGRNDPSIDPDGLVTTDPLEALLLNEGALGQEDVLISMEAAPLNVG